MSRSSSITPADFKRIYAIRVILLLIWGGLLVFGIITLFQPDWLTDISKKGKESEAMDINKTGVNFMNEKRFNEAINKFKRALVLNPELYEARGNMAISYVRLGNSDKAEKTFKKMIKKIPERDYIGYLNLGDIYKDKKDKKDKENKENKENKKKKKNKEKARDYYLQSLRTNPFPGEAYKQAGFCSQELGDLKLALEYYDLAISKMSDFEQLYSGSLKRDQFGLRKNAEALQQVEDLMAVEDATEILTKYDEQILHSIQDSDPNIAKIYYHKGMIFKDLGDVEMAKLAFQKALIINPKNTYARNELSQISQN